MTAPQQDDTKLTAAKAFFIGFFALALGWAGVLVAAVAVATEQTWSNGRVETGRNRERRAGWFDTQRAWLDNDHRARTARADQHREWLQAGADPERAPARRSRWRRFLAGLRRQVAHTAVAGQDFARGARDGWRAADRTRRDGGSFRDIARTRPGDTPIQPEEVQPAADSADPSADVAAQHVCRNCMRSGPVDHNGVCEDCNQPTPGSAPAEQTDNPTSGTPDTATQQAVPESSQNTEGEPMTAPTDSNATVLAKKLTDINTTVGQVSADTDQLSSITAELRAKVRSAADLAHSAGMPTDAVVAVDAVQHAAGVLDTRLEDFSTGAAESTDLLTSATEGLAPVVQAEDRLRAAGADGRVFDTAAA